MKNYATLKRWMDLLLAILLIVPLGPLIVILCICIYIDSPGNPIYAQTRVGKNNQLFQIYKLRSMKIGTPVLSTAEMQAQDKIPFTRLGPLLRKTNLDELPQLLNILKGEMSFIGPRPALPSQTDVNNLRTEHGVHRLRPGITGLAQVRGRDNLGTVTKVAYDAEYCRKMSLCLDLAILGSTLIATLTAHGNK